MADGVRSQTRQAKWFRRKEAAMTAVQHVAYKRECAEIEKERRDSLRDATGDDAAAPVAEA